MLNKILFLLFLFVSLNLYSQDIRSAKNKAKYKIQDMNYAGAISIYLDLLKDDDLVDYTVFTKLGYCYINTGDFDNAIFYLKKSVDYYTSINRLKKKEALDAMYYLATGYFMKYDFQRAKILYIQIRKYSNKKQIKELNRKIIQCDSARVMLQNPKGFFVYQSGIINSDFPDYCPVVSVSQEKIFFTSRRPGSTGNKKDIDGFEFDDIYSVDISNGNFSKPVKIDGFINTLTHEATASISFDGKTMFLYKSTSKDPGDIYVSKFINNKWSLPKRMDKPINSRFNETHASISPDGKHLYFTSDRKKGFGGLDIYQADLAADGSWENVRNMGEYINTPEDEEGPFLSPDGNTIYFSSKGHIGMGGYDIYKFHKLADGTWSKPVNMGFPLNTVNDDMFYIPTNNPEQAFYSSKQVGGMTSILVVKIFDNIDNMLVVKGYIFDSKTKYLAPYHIVGDSVEFMNTLYGQGKKVYLDNDTVHIFHHKNNAVLDSICKIPPNTSIKVYKVSDKSLVGNYSASLLGKYRIILNSQEKYIVHFSAPGYTYDFYETDDKAKTYYYTAELDSIINNETKIVKNSNFKKDSVGLTNSQKIELNFVVDYLQQNENLYVDVSAFGKKNDIAENLDLPRTYSIINYLTEKGIDDSQIFMNLSNDVIKDSTVQYTIYSEKLIQNEVDNKQPNIIPNTSNIISNSSNIIHGVLVSDVKFEINMYDIKQFYEDLNVLSQFLISNKQAKIGVYGYTDTQGPSNYNIMLAKKRAISVKNYLIKKGAKPNQITAEGRGYSKQIAINKDNQGDYVWNSLPYNRRVEIEIIEQGENEKLFVKPIDVPNQFQINTSGKDYFYSVNVVSSITQIPAGNFDFEVIELLGVDGVYNYITGEFANENQAENYANSIKHKYSKSYVFINNYRK